MIIIMAPHVAAHLMEGVSAEETLMHQQRLHGVTCSGVISLGIQHNLDRLKMA